MTENEAAVQRSVSDCTFAIKIFCYYNFLSDFKNSKAAPCPQKTCYKI